MSAGIPIGDDMVDSGGEMPECEAVRDEVSFADEVLLENYRAADKRAQSLQKWHRRVAIAAAVLGTLAVLGAIVGLSKGYDVLPEAITRMWGKIEVVAAMTAFVAVICGLLLAFQRHWLLERHRAERCRILKFGFLTDPALWCGDSDAVNRRREQLHAEAGKVRGLSAPDLEQWLADDGKSSKQASAPSETEIARLLRHDVAPENPPAEPRCAIDPGTLLSLVKYYRTKRLGVQMRFFLRRTEENKSRHRRTWRLPPILFFCSIVAALFHFIAEAAKWKIPHEWTVYLILLAAGLPVIGAGVRTYRSTYEFARNAMRYEAKLLSLQHLIKNIISESGRQNPDARRIFSDLRYCEQIFDLEHREWLRLMLDAEWYG